MRRTADETDANEQVYSTKEGDVLLAIDGTNVFISEGFPLPLARKLRDSIGGVQVEGPLQLARMKNEVGPAAFDPGVALVHIFSSVGMMKAAIRSERPAAQRYTLDKQ